MRNNKLTKQEISFFEIAIEDLKVSKLLFKKENFPHALYFLQQSIEKLTKFYGLANNIIRIDNLKKVSHESSKIFGKIVSKQADDFNQNSKILRTRLPYFENFMTSISDGKFDIEKMGVFFTSNKNEIIHLKSKDFADITDEELNQIFQLIRDVENINLNVIQFEKFMAKKRESINALLEKVIVNYNEYEVFGEYGLNNWFSEFLKAILPILKKSSSIVVTLFFFSLIFNSHCSSTRYPNEKSPNETYVKNHILVAKFEQFVVQLESCIDDIHDFFVKR